MKIIMKSVLITLAFNANSSLGLTADCTDADSPWDVQTIGLFSASEALMHNQVYVYSFVDYWIIGHNDPDPIEWSGGAYCDLGILEGDCHHLINLPLGTTAILEGTSTFENGLPYVYCPYAHYYG